MVKFGLRKLLAETPGGVFWVFPNPVSGGGGGGTPPPGAVPPGGVPLTPTGPDGKPEAKDASGFYPSDPRHPLPNESYEAYITRQLNAERGIQPSGDFAPQAIIDRAKALNTALNLNWKGDAAWYSDRNVMAFGDTYLAQNPQDLTWGGTGPRGPEGGGIDPTGDLIAPWTQKFSFPDWKPPSPFTPPTGLTEQNDPGYQERLRLGQEAVDWGAASKGTLLGGGTLKELENYGQTFASNEYANVYGRALQNYTTDYNSSLNDWTQNYNKAFQGYQTAYNVYENNQANAFNRINSVFGEQMGAVNQLTQGGLSAAQLTASTLGGNANTLGGLYTGAGNANAGATAAGANIAAGLYSNLGQIPGNYFANWGSGGSGYAPPSYAPPTSTPNGAPPYNPYG